MEKSKKFENVTNPVWTVLGPLFVKTKACETVGVPTAVLPKLKCLGETTKNAPALNAMAGKTNVKSAQIPLPESLAIASSTWPDDASSPDRPNVALFLPVEIGLNLTSISQLDPVKGR
jgi:hypothetical protein